MAFSKPSHTFTNAELGLESYVFDCADGFLVALKDTDADVVLPTSLKFQDPERAVAYAKQCAVVA